MISLVITGKNKLVGCLPVMAPHTYVDAECAAALALKVQAHASGARLVAHARAVGAHVLPLLQREVTPQALANEASLHILAPACWTSASAHARGLQSRAHASQKGRTEKRTKKCLAARSKATLANTASQGSAGESRARSYSRGLLGAVVDLSSALVCARHAASAAAAAAACQIVQEGVCALLSLPVESCLPSRLCRDGGKNGAMVDSAA
jgi:hypothetical protein